MEGSGANLVGVSLTPDPRLNDNPSRIRRIVEATGAALVQPITVVIPPPGVRAALSEAGIGIVYGGIEIAHDDDPGWILTAHAATDNLNAALYQADVLTEYRDSWEFLRDESPEFEDEFQIADLNELAREHPLVVGFNFTSDNVKEIVTALPEVRGIALTLAQRARRGDARFHLYTDALRVLQAM